jgi:hypothetical protein
LPATQIAPANETTAPRLYTRAEALAVLKIGETTLFWLQRTGKLKPIHIGSRVLFSATEIARVATRGASLTEAEKKEARRRGSGESPGRLAGRAGTLLPDGSLASHFCNASLGPFGGGTTKMRDGGRRRHKTNVDK